VPLLPERKTRTDALSYVTEKLMEQAKALEAFKGEVYKREEEKEKVLRTIAEKTKSLMESVNTINQTIEKLNQGIPTNPVLEQSVKDLPVVKAQLASTTNRLAQIEKTLAEMTQTLLARIEGIELSQASMPGSSGGASPRSGAAWGSRNIEAQIQLICRDLSRALPKELQPSAEAALNKATKAFMSEFVKNFSQGLKPTKGQQSRTMDVSSASQRTATTAPIRGAG
jgi:seryl-tRNA synthetase